MIVVFLSILAVFTQCDARLRSMSQAPARLTATSLRRLVATNSISAPPKTAMGDSNKESAIVIGSGPIGLATAVMLVQQGVHHVQVFDQLSEPPRPDDESFWGTFRSERSYNIGVTGRGQLVLRDLGVWNNVEKFTAEVYGSAEWTPGTPTDKPLFRLQERRYPTRCIERDRLTGCLLQAIREQYCDRISVTFDTKCIDLTWKDKGTNLEQCAVTIEEKRTMTQRVLQAPLVIGCDGSNSIVRDTLLKVDPDFKTQKYDEINEYVYRTVPIVFNCSAVDEFCAPGKFMSYSMRSSVGLNMESLPTVEGIHLGVMLFKPENALIANLTSSADARKLLDDHFPVASAGITEEAVERFAQQSNNRFQRFQYVYPKLHHSRSVCLLGDSIHTVKPYFGLGVNSGLEDVAALKLALQTHDDKPAEALRAFSTMRAKEGKALVQMSQRMDRGFIYFILPLIIDKVFHNALPWLFEKSLVGCMQDESKTFTQVMRRKRIDRIMQISVFSLVTMGILHCVVTAVQKLLLPAIVWLSRRRCLLMR